MLINIKRGQQYISEHNNILEEQKNDKFMYKNPYMKILRQKIGEKLAKKFINDAKKKKNESENLDLIKSKEISNKIIII